MIAAPRILLVDDDEDDSVLIRDLLSDAFPTGMRPDWADGFESGLSAMLAGSHDVFLVDYRLGRRDGLDLVREAVRRGCRAPVILLTGQDCLQTDLEAMDAGAVDFLVKGEISAAKLERSIRYAIQRRRVERRLERLGFEDPLTGLANRSLFRDRLERSVTLAGRERRSFAVAMMDLDGFKAVNDTFGHAAGDVVLVEVARRAKAVLRESDTLARIGGDEIAAILPTAASVEGAVVVAERLVETASRPIVLDHGEVSVGLSVGIAFFPADGDQPDAVLESADRAMYEAKRGGRGYAVADGLDRAQSVESAVLVRRLVEAIERDELDIHHQPMIDLRSGAVRGTEALARWQHPERGCLTPADFIAAAEKTAAIGPMTTATLVRALQHAAGFRAAGHDLAIAVNLSTCAFRDDALPDRIARIVAESGLPADAVTLEVSEAGLVGDFDRAAAMLRRIAATGVAISIDDFGIGLSAFARLRELPIAEIKIHGSLVGNLTDGGSDLAVVRSILSMCREFKLRSVAEAVETEAALDRLRSLGCDVAQGFGVARPMPADQVGDWVERWNRTAAPRPAEVRRRTASAPKAARRSAGGRAGRSTR